MGSRFIAMLALEQPCAVSEKVLSEEIALQFPGQELSLTGMTPDRDRADTQTPLMLRMGNAVVTVMWMDLPIPPDSLEPAIAGAHRWPEARARLAGHRAHAVVATVTDAKNWKDAVDAAYVITAVSSALASLLPCIGVYWSTGMIVTEASRFQERARKEACGPAALDLWMQVQVVAGPSTPAGDKTHGLLSFGLVPFFGRDIEFTPSRLAPFEVAALGFSTVLHMMMNGPPQDGSLVDLGSSATVRARISQRGWRSGQPAIEITVEGTPPDMGVGGDPSETPKQAGPCKFMGILAVAEAISLDAREIVKRMDRRFPSYEGPPAEAVESAADEAEGQGKCRIRIGDMTAIVGVLNQPIYATILDTAVRAATGWPEAGQQLSGHRAQIIVELVSPSGGTVVGRVDAASIATMLCAAVADLIPVFGIYWKNGGTVTEPWRFQDVAGGLMSGEMPLDIWLQVVQLKESAYVVSTGLSDFLGCEMEFKAAGMAEEEAIQRGFLVCRQLLAHGDILRDNERIPLDDAEDIWPRWLLDGQREDIPVWSLTIEKRRGTSGLPGPEAARAPLSGPPPPSSAPPSPRESSGTRPAAGAGGSSGGAIQMPRGRPGGDKCEPGSFTTILALEKPASVVEAELMERMRQQFPQLQSRIKSPTQPGAIPESGAPMIFFMGDCMVTVMFVDGPVPPGTLTIAARASRVWPEAEQELAAHRGHVIVHAKSKTDDWNGALNGAQNVTVVSAALAGMLPTIGVYWSAGWVVSKAAEFIDGAEKMLAGNYPTHLWVQFWFLDGPKTEKGETTDAVLTTGLEPFFGREIEFLPAAIPPMTILHRLLGAMQYLLTSGPVLEHGNTLGVSEDEHIRVRHADQGQRPGIPVYMFTLEALDESVKPFPSGKQDRPSETAKPAMSGDGAKPAPNQPNDAVDTAGRFTGIIALERPALVDQIDFTKLLLEQFPQFRDSVDSTEEQREASRAADRFMFDMGGCTVGVMFFDQPLPAGSLDEVARSNFNWPDAEQELARHQAHVMFHARSRGGDWKDSLNCAQVVTVVGAVLADMLPAIGVNWCEGVTISKAAEFIESAPKIVAGQYTEANWFRHWIATDPDLPEAERTIAMGTIGLKLFFGREIEFAPAPIPPATMAKRLLAAIQYLLTKGPVLKDGSALRVGETERIRVRHADKGTVPGVPVYHLTLEKTGQEGAQAGPAAQPSPATAQPPASESPPRPAAPQGTDEPRKPLFGRRQQD